MTVKLLAVDLDGTLLNRDGHVHPADRSAMVAAQRAGLATAIVTGRLYSGTRDAAVACEIAGPVACVDGAHIVLAGTDLFHQPIEHPHARTLRTLLQHHHTLAAFVFAHDEVVHDDAGDLYLDYVKTWSRSTVRHGRVTEHPHWEHARGISQVACVGPSSLVHGVADALTQEVGDAALVLRFPVGPPERDTWALLVRSASCTKGTAVDFLAAHHGCTVEDVAVVGDWINDVPMFERAGRSFVMGQAPSAVKETASDVLQATNLTGGGVAEALRALGISF